MDKELEAKIKKDTNIAGIKDDERKHKTSLFVLFEDGLVELIYDDSELVPPEIKTPDEHFRWDILNNTRKEIIKLTWGRSRKGCGINLELHPKDSKKFKDCVAKVFEENI